ncbi:gustatory receptor for bitter taste 22e-like [Drosophila innubila]|uniref:gustatory receptor for bitter taste 22e-like n=1 Tax=Drosophila innubila TaxID=198719 RepID=UPI00148C2199|nr:gustatory receptor for bitter taste 22e-like [Drosophila innubila]
MSRAHRSWYRKFVQFNLWATLYSSWVLGLFPFIYNSRTRKIKRSRWLVGYGIILNVVLVWTAFKNYAATEPDAITKVFVHNPLAEHINQMHSVLLLSTFFVTYFRNWWLSEELGRILNMLLDLHHRHFIENDSNGCKDFDNYIIYKGSCIMLELISLIILEFSDSPNYSFGMLLGVFSILFMQLGVLLVGMHFHLAVMFIYRSLWIINRELFRLVNYLSVMRTTKSATSRVLKLHYLYKRLLELNQRLVAIYDYQITLVMMSLLTVNIISPFYLIVYAISLKNPLTIYFWLNFLQAMSINVMDFWLHISVCELAVRTNQGTARIIKLFNDIPDLGMDLERSLTHFVLFSSHQRVKFNHFGMFDVHNSMGFRMIIACTLYLVYLVQFDFMNL